MRNVKDCKKLSKNDSTKQKLTIYLPAAVSCNGTTLMSHGDELVWTSPNIGKRIDDKDLKFTYNKHNMSGVFFKNGRVMAHVHVTLSDLEKLLKTAKRKQKRLGNGFFIHFGNVNFFVERPVKRRTK